MVDRQRLASKKLARSRIAAMHRPIFERPQLAGSHPVRRVAPEQARADAEQDPAPLLQTFSLWISPWERLQQRKPCVLQLRQLVTAHTFGQEFACNCLQSRLGGRLDASIQLLKPLAPPGETDGAKPWIAARCDGIREREVELPQCREGGPQLPRQLLERYYAVGIERPLSDR